MNPLSNERKEELLRMRIFIPAAISMLGLLVILTTLYVEQIRSGQNSQKQVSRQSIRQIRIPAKRGLIYTSDLTSLTENTHGFELLFYPGEMRRRKRSDIAAAMLLHANRISLAAEVQHSLTLKQILIHLNTRPGLPLRILSNLNNKEAARVLEVVRDIPGAVVQPMETRSYPQKRLACHLIGYTRQANPQKAPDREDFFYYLPDDIGKEGVEKSLDRLELNGKTFGLRGSPGYSLIQVDYLGYARKNLIERIDPVNGTHMILTIDSDMQRLAEKLLTGKRGAITVLNADNGDILAAASAPGYDLGLFAPKISSREYNKLRDDPDNPLFNRAFQGVYPPGSILKPLIMLRYLQTGVDPEEKINCTGSSEVYGVSIRCASYRRGGHGPLNMEDALKYSCNVYMIEHAKKIGFGPIVEVINEAGFGSLCGTGLPEASGIFPSDILKRRRTGFGWNTYDTALLSIGQGLIGITPLQAAVYCAALANGGIIWKPNILLRAVDSSGNEVWQRSPEIRNRLSAAPEHLKKIDQAMNLVVNAWDGSGREAKLEDLEIRGKTGSAEFGTKGNFRIYAWFIAYAKIHGRTIAAAFIVEEGVSGGRTCAPLAAEFFAAIAKDAMEKTQH